jgi:hypothetical protein
MTGGKSYMVTGESILKDIKTLNKHRVRISLIAGGTTLVTHYWYGMNIEDDYIRYLFHSVSTGTFIYTPTEDISDEIQLNFEISYKSTIDTSDNNTWINIDVHGNVTEI